MTLSNNSMRSRFSIEAETFPIETYAILTFSVGFFFKLCFILSVTQFYCIQPSDFWGQLGGPEPGLFEMFAVTVCLLFILGTLPLIFHFSGLQRFERVSLVASAIICSFTIYLGVGLAVLHNIDRDVKDIAVGVQRGWFDVDPIMIGSGRCHRSERHNPLDDESGADLGWDQGRL